MHVWFVGEYVKIVDGERLVYTELMSTRTASSSN